MNRAAPPYAHWTRTALKKAYGTRTRRSARPGASAAWSGSGSRGRLRNALPGWIATFISGCCSDDAPSSLGSRASIPTRRRGRSSSGGLTATAKERASRSPRRRSCGSGPRRGTSGTNGPGVDRMTRGCGCRGGATGFSRFVSRRPALYLNPPQCLEKGLL